MLYQMPKREVALPSRSARAGSLRLRWEVRRPSNQCAAHATAPGAPGQPAAALPPAIGTVTIPGGSDVYRIVPQQAQNSGPEPTISCTRSLWIQTATC